jgi:hypothetical protein
MMVYFFPKLYRTLGVSKDMLFIRLKNQNLFNSSDKNLMVERFYGPGSGYRWQQIKRLWKFIWVTKGESFFYNEAMFEEV